MATALSRMSLTSSTERASATARQAASYRANWPSYRLGAACCAAGDARLLRPADLLGSKHACRAPPSPPAEFAFVGGTDGAHACSRPTVLSSGRDAAQTSASARRMRVLRPSFTARSRRARNLLICRLAADPVGITKVFERQSRSVHFFASCWWWWSRSGPLMSTHIGQPIPHYFRRDVFARALIFVDADWSSRAARPVVSPWQMRRRTKSRSIAFNNCLSETKASW